MSTLSTSSTADAVTSPNDTSSKSIATLIVDDSALMRGMLSDFVNAELDLNAVGVARNGEEALRKITSLSPDVVTLDVQMPGKDGLETLEDILAQHAIPIVMVSSLTERGADITLRALEIGAVDYIAKPSDNQDRERFRQELIGKIRSVAGTDVRRLQKIRNRRKSSVLSSPAATEPTKVILTSDTPATYFRTCIAIGISTGGPPALAALLAQLSPPLPPIVIVQHMPEQFTGPFAKRLNEHSPLAVKEAESGDRLQPNHVFVARGGHHLELIRQGSHVALQIVDGEPVSGHRPSVDVMMQSASRIFGRRCLGIIMTGMGSDGVAGCQSIQQAGGFVLGQDQASSDVYGMNKAAFVAGAVNEQFSLDDLPKLIPTHCRRLFLTH
jgi:two-component system chemotaxis response regulator CheB